MSTAIEDMIAKSSKMQEDLDKNRSVGDETPTASDIVNKNHGAKSNTDTTINGKKFLIKKYNIKEWLQVTPFLGKRFAPSAALMFSGSETGIAEGSMALFDSLDGDGLLEVCEILISNVTIEGAKVTLETFEDPLELMELCVAVLQENYQKVFTKGIQGLAQAMGNVSEIAKTL